LARPEAISSAKHKVADIKIKAMVFFMRIS
jgi:hypothetical protein